MLRALAKSEHRYRRTIERLRKAGLIEIRPQRGGIVALTER